MEVVAVLVSRQRRLRFVVNARLVHILQGGIRVVLPELLQLVDGRRGHVPRVPGLLFGGNLNRNRKMGEGERGGARMK